MQLKNTIREFRMQPENLICRVRVVSGVFQFYVFDPDRSNEPVKLVTGFDTAKEAFQSLYRWLSSEYGSWWEDSRIF